MGRSPFCAFTAARASKPVFFCTFGSGDGWATMVCNIGSGSYPHAPCLISRLDMRHRCSSPLQLRSDILVCKFCSICSGFRLQQEIFITRTMESGKTSLTFSHAEVIHGGLSLHMWCHMPRSKLSSPAVQLLISICSSLGSFSSYMPSRFVLDSICFMPIS